MKVEAEVLQFFAENGAAPIPGKTDAERLACRYLDAGLIDSMRFVEMVTTFEQKYELRFSAEDLQSNEFLTIGGVASVIAKRLADKKP